MYEVKILVGSLKGEVRYAFPYVKDLLDGAVVVDQGDELWYDSDEIEFLSSVVEMDCE